MATPAQLAEAIRVLGAKNYKMSLREEGIQSTTSGNSVGMTGNPQSDYAKRTMTMPAATDPQSYPRSMDDLKDAHDRIAYIAQMPCAPDTMEAIRKFGDSIIYEAGKTISDGNMKHLVKAHDGIAKSCGMTCDSSASPQEKLFQQHQQTIKSMQETHNQRMQELVQLATKQNAYSPRNRIREKVINALQEGESLADRSRPLPFEEKEMDSALQELSKIYLALYDDIYGLDGIPARFR